MLAQTRVMSMVGPQMNCNIKVASSPVWKTSYEPRTIDEDSHCSQTELVFSMLLILIVDSRSQDSGSTLRIENDS